MDSNELKKEPFLSVRLMTYNHEPYIAEAIEGCLIQETSFPFEIVIGDDFSTDKTLSIAKAYEKKYPQIIKVLNRPYKGEYWQKRQKRGRYYNFINILENCKGKYIALLDGDDYWTDSNKLQAQVDFLEKNTQYSFSCHTFSTINEKKEIKISDSDLVGKYPMGFEVNRKLFLIRWVTKTLTVVFRKDALDIDFTNHKIFTDFVLIYYLLKKKMGFWLNLNYGNYRLHNSNIYVNQKKLQQLEHAYKIRLYLLKKNAGDAMLLDSFKRITSKILHQKELIKSHQNFFSLYTFMRILNHPRNITDYIKLIYQYLYRSVVLKYLKPKN